jgi:hypothetical protein
MGFQSDAASNDFPIINDVQKSLLNWPEVVLGTTQPNTIDLAKKSAIFSTKIGTENGIAQLTLDNEYIYDGFNGGPDGTFTKLTFATDCQPYNRLFNCVNIYLQNNSSTVLVGMLESPKLDKPDTFIVKMHAQNVRVTFTGDTIEIKDITVI